MDGDDVDVREICDKTAPLACDMVPLVNTASDTVNLVVLGLSLCTKIKTLRLGVTEGEYPAAKLIG